MEPSWMWLVVGLVASVLVGLGCILFVYLFARWVLDFSPIYKRQLHRMRPELSDEEIEDVIDKYLE